MEEPIGAALQIDNIRLELGYGLLSLINNQRTPAHRADQGASPPTGERDGLHHAGCTVQDNLQLPEQLHPASQEIEASSGNSSQYASRNGSAR